MPSTVNDVLFSEPSGRPNSLVQFAGAFAFLVIYLYFYVYLGGTSGTWVLAMALGAVLSGTAESLPIHRRKIAGTLRVASILTFVCLIAAIVLSPGIVTG
ncbi:hypothetical protein [Haloarcula montana]|uniref:hypothetical protein n=1 Tax=Haloarcula montana TaxID=3111776 RepID=UPI002D7783A1|nr:hypothetical protein [Haloarcula sp. GH36]